MSYLVIALLLGALVWIAVSDFRSRSILLVLFPVLFILSFLKGYMLDGWNILPQFGLNLIFLAIILGSVRLMFKLRGDAEFMDVQFGTGDLLMLVAITPMMAELEYLWSITFAAIGAILVYYPKIKKQTPFPIPFAGVMALIVGGLVVMEVFNFHLFA